jgi:hypothetical protein
MMGRALGKFPSPRLRPFAAQVWRRVRLPSRPDTVHLQDAAGQPDAVLRSVISIGHSGGRRAVGFARPRVNAVLQSGCHFVYFTGIIRCSYGLPGHIT